MKRYLRANTLTFRPDYDTYYNGGPPQYKLSNGDILPCLWDIIGTGENRLDLPQIHNSYCGDTIEHFTEEFIVRSNANKTYRVVREVRKYPDTRKNYTAIIDIQEL